MTSAQRTPLMIVILCAIIGMVLLQTTFTDQIFQAGDNTGYMVLGIALSRGEGFRDISHPQAPHRLWWPPGWPLILGWFHAVAGPRWVLAKRVVFVLFFAAAALWGVHCTRAGGMRLGGCACAVALALSGPVHMLSSYLYSETWFCICLILFFWFWQRWKGACGVWRTLLLALGAVYIGSVRIMGMVLPLALALELFAERAACRGRVRYRWIIALTLLAIYTAAITWVPAVQVGSFHSFFRPAPPAPVHGLEGVQSSFVVRAVTRIPESLRGYFFTLIPQSLLPATYDLGTMNRFKQMWTALVTLTVLWGMVVGWKRFRLHVMVTVLAAGVLLVYGPLYFRLLVPLIPLLVLFFWLGVRDGAGRIRLPARMVPGVVALLWGWMLCDNAYYTLSHPRKHMPPGFGGESYQQCMNWALDSIPPGRGITSQIPWYLYLHRATPSLFYEQSRMGDPHQTLAWLEEEGGEYLIVSRIRERPHLFYMDVMRQTVEQYPYHFDLLYGSEEAPCYVVRFSKGDE